MSLVVPVSTSEDESIVLVPGVVGDTEEQPGTGDGVGTQLGGVRVVDVASRSSSLVSHQPATTGQEVESEVRPSVLSVGGVVVVAREGTRNTTIYPSLTSSYLVITSTTTYTS